MRIGSGMERAIAQAVEKWYKRIPILVRSYLTAAIITPIGCSLDVSPLSLLWFSLFDFLSDYPKIKREIPV